MPTDGSAPPRLLVPDRSALLDLCKPYTQKNKPCDYASTFQAEFSSDGKRVYMAFRVFFGGIGASNQGLAVVDTHDVTGSSFKIIPETIAMPDDGSMFSCLTSIPTMSDLLVYVDAYADIATYNITSGESRKRYDLPPIGFGCPEYLPGTNSITYMVDKDQAVSTMNSRNTRTVAKDLAASTLNKRTGWGVPKWGDSFVSNMTVLRGSLHQFEQVEADLVRNETRHMFWMRALNAQHMQDSPNRQQCDVVRNAFDARLTCLGESLFDPFIVDLFVNPKSGRTEGSTDREALRNGVMTTRPFKMLKL